MAPRYNPYAGITTIQIPYIALVSRVDPNWNRYKYREIQYEFSGKVFIENPYQQGPYVTPIKNVTLNYSGNVTLAAGDITGVGFDYVVVNSTSASPGVFTTRTSSQMFSDINNATIPMGYYLRINNIGEGSPITIGAPDKSVTLIGTMVIPQNTYSDFLVSFVSSDGADVTGVTITTYTFNNLYKSVSQL